MKTTLTNNNQVTLSIIKKIISERLLHLKRHDLVSKILIDNIHDNNDSNKNNNNSIVSYTPNKCYLELPYH